ncbi:MAG: WXG100 family type VII secretion target [Myxococcales bacterium]|jgi:WXG100 family type VII secretion target|nr:WXG100 family type VII secretion target [Myxococcales bacterium]
MAEEFRADYEQLEKIANQFANLGERATRTLQQMRQQYDELINDGNWIGRGSAAFSSEMEGEIFPALERLIDALGQAQGATARIVSMAQDAEENACARFDRR